MPWPKFQLRIPIRIPFRRARPSAQRTPKLASPQSVNKAQRYFTGESFTDAFLKDAPPGWVRDEQSLRMVATDGGYASVKFDRLRPVPSLPPDIDNSRVHATVSTTDGFGFHLTLMKEGEPLALKHWFFDDEGVFKRSDRFDESGKKQGNSTYDVFLPDHWVSDMAREFTAWYRFQRVKSARRES